MMEALVSLKRDGFTPPCEVWVVAAVDEEHTYRGVVKLCEGLSAQAAVVAEPTEMKAVIASKGCLRWRVVVEGKPAHSSKPELGVNAIYQMARVVAALEQDSGNMTGRVHPLVGSPTCSVGLIQGGTQINIIPAECWIEIDRRLIPGERADEVLAHYAGIMDQVKAAIPSMKVHFEKPSVEDIALDTPADSQIARLASAVLSDLGLDGRPVGVPFGSDASKLSRQGIPSIVLGPGSIDLAHTQEEYVECDQVEQAFQFYSQIMRNFE
jgi:acetylornithine deacetylase